MGGGTEVPIHPIPTTPPPPPLPAAAPVRIGRRGKKGMGGVQGASAAATRAGRVARRKSKGDRAGGARPQERQGLTTPVTGCVDRRGFGARSGCTRLRTHPRPSHEHLSRSRGRFCTSSTPSAPGVYTVLSTPVLAAAPGCAPHPALPSVLPNTPLWPDVGATYTVGVAVKVTSGAASTTPAPAPLLHIA